MSLEQKNAAEVLRVNANEPLLSPERLEHRISGLKEFRAYRSVLG